MRLFIPLTALAMASLAAEEHRTVDPVALLEQAEAAFEASALYEIDPLLLVAVAWEESRFDASRESERGAVGPLQVLPRFVPFRRAEVAQIHGGYHAGAWALSRWRAHCAVEALACYNGGGEPGRQAMRYAARVRKTMRDLRAFVDVAEVIWVSGAAGDAQRAHVR